MSLWNVFDAEMVLRGIYRARNWMDAVAIVSGWHSTSNIEGWRAYRAD